MRTRHVGSVILAMAIAAGLGPAVTAAPQGAGAPAAKGQTVRGPADQGAEMYRGADRATGPKASAMARPRRR